MKLFKEDFKVPKITTKKGPWRDIQLFFDCYLILYWLVTLILMIFTNYTPTRFSIGLAVASAALLWFWFLFEDYMKRYK